MCSSDLGKTWVLCAMGAYAISQKLSVVHYTLELNEAYVGLRYDSIFSGFEGQNLKYHKEEVMEKLFKLDGKLTIKYYPTKSCTVNTLSAHLKKAMTFGEKIDMVIVDYADIMRDIHKTREVDRKSTRLNSSHKPISYAVFCLKKKTTKN
mgnify:CR=1 FL=1